MKIRIVLYLLMMMFVLVNAEVLIVDSEVLTFDSAYPLVEISSPAGGEVLAPGVTIAIEFSIAEDYFAENPVEPVVLEFYFDDVHEAAYDISLVAEEDSLYEYNWTVPEIISENVVVKVTATDYYGNLGEVVSGILIIEEMMGIIYGDIDDNGEVESYDVSLILMNLVGMDPIPEDPIPWEEWRMLRADVDLDGNLLALDASYILQYVVEIITELPVINDARGFENIVSISNDEDYLYLTSESNLLSLQMEMLNSNNLKLGASEVVGSDCMYNENNGKLALATAAGVTGNILRIPYDRKNQGEADITMKVECNGYFEEVNYTLSDPLPETTQLSSIYPNPFNPVTTIDYEVATESNVKLEVYNIRGQKVTVLLIERKDAGNYSFNWNAEGLNSGIYFLRFTSDGYQKTSKVLLLK